jgi:hypothetical protein
MTFESRKMQQSPKWETFQLANGHFSGLILTLSEPACFISGILIEGGDALLCSSPSSHFSCPVME